MRRIVLYFPFRGVGGVSLLFQRLSQQLAGVRKISLVDFHDGFMSKSVPGGVELVDFDTVTRYPQDAVLVVQSLAPWNIRDIDKFDDDTRVLFWNLHPLNFYPYTFSLHSASRWKALVARMLLPLSILRRRKLARTVEYLSARNALVFMDGENYERTVSFFPGRTIQKRFLPIMSPAAKPSRKEIGRELQCCWIGRIVDFKFHILLHLIGRLDRAVPIAGPINMIVVGDGDHLDRLKAEASAYRNVSLTFVPNVPPAQMDDFLGANVDVLFAMGTSALEGASRHVPTILLDYSYYPIRGLYRFKYIFDATDYSLAELIQEKRHMEPTSTFEETLKGLRLNYNEIRQSCYEYWLRHHSPDAVTRLFLSCVDGTTATIGEMRKLGLFKGDLVSLAMKRLLRLWRTPSNIHGFLEN